MKKDAILVINMKRLNTKRADKLLDEISDVVSKYDKNFALLLEPYPSKKLKMMIQKSAEI
jgi:hypothetical protein